MGDQSLHAGTAVTGLERVEPDEVKPGATRPGQRRFFRMPDGSLSVRQMPEADGDLFGAHIEAPPGGREIAATEGEEVLARNRVVRDEQRAAARATAARQRADDYDALLALGLPEQTAARMSGHAPAGP
jgi:hypothetical protein